MFLRNSETRNFKSPPVRVGKLSQDASSLDFSENRILFQPTKRLWWMHFVPDVKLLSQTVKLCPSSSPGQLLSPLYSPEAFSAPHLSPAMVPWLLTCVSLCFPLSTHKSAWSGALCCAGWDNQSRMWLHVLKGLTGQGGGIYSLIQR